MGALGGFLETPSVHCSLKNERGGFARESWGWEWEGSGPSIPGMEEERDSHTQRMLVSTPVHQALCKALGLERWPMCIMKA